MGEQHHACFVSSWIQAQKVGRAVLHGNRVYNTSAFHRELHKSLAEGFPSLDDLGCRIPAISSDGDPAQDFIGLESRRKVEFFGNLEVEGRISAHRPGRHDASNACPQEVLAVLGDQVGNRNIGNGGDFPGIRPLHLGQGRKAFPLRQVPVASGARSGAHHRNRVLADLGLVTAATDRNVPLTHAQQGDILRKTPNNLGRIGAIPDPVLSPAPVPSDHLGFGTASSNTVPEGLDHLRNHFRSLAHGAARAVAGSAMTEAVRQVF